MDLLPCPSLRRARRWVVALALVSACGPDDTMSEDAQNVCTYEVGGCIDNDCPPSDDDFTEFCVDTSLGAPCNIPEDVTEEFDGDLGVTFYTYTRNVQFMADVTCADLGL